MVLVVAGRRGKTCRTGGRDGEAGGLSAGRASLIEPVADGLNAGRASLVPSAPAAGEVTTDRGPTGEGRARAAVPILVGAVAGLDHGAGAVGD